MPIMRTDGKTVIQKAPAPDRLTIYDKETGEAYEKFPVDAHECVASGAYTFEKHEEIKANDNAETEAEKEDEVTDEKQETVEAEAEKKAEEKVDYSTFTKKQLIDLAREQGKAANNTMNKEAIIALLS